MLSKFVNTNSWVMWIILRQFQILYKPIDEEIVMNEETLCKKIDLSLITKK